MSYVTWSIVRTPLLNNSWSSTNAETLSTYYDPILTMESGTGRDSFSLKLTNFNNEFSNYFKLQDKLSIYRTVNNDATVSTDLLMTGVVQNVPEERNSANNLIRVEGYNFSEAIMSALVFYDAQNKTVPEALEGAVNSVRLYNDRLGVTWNASNPSLKRNGTPFPIVGERFFYKSLKEIFEKYSTNTGTEDDTYYWYVDSNNTVVWRPASSTLSYSFNSETDTYYTSLKIGKNIKDVKNFIIIKGGNDPDNKAIQDRVQDYSSINQNGFKYYIDTSVAKSSGDIHTADANACGVTHMRDAAYPYTTSFWKSLDSGVYETFSSYHDYVEKLRLHIKALCRQTGKKILDGTKGGRLQITVDYPPGIRAWGLGDLLSVSIPSLGGAKSLRVTAVQHTTTMDSFTLEEDFGKGTL